MYELFSIMVHSGGASGGHYFAYIKYVSCVVLCTSTAWLRPVEGPDLMAACHISCGLVD